MSPSVGCGFCGMELYRRPERTQDAPRNFHQRILMLNDLLARVIVYLGKVDEAEKQARHAVELNPVPAYLVCRVTSLGFFCLPASWMSGNVIARKAAESAPDCCIQSSIPGVCGGPARRW